MKEHNLLTVDSEVKILSDNRFTIRFEEPYMVYGCLYFFDIMFGNHFLIDSIDSTGLVTFKPLSEEVNFSDKYDRREVMNIQKGDKAYFMFPPEKDGTQLKLITF